MSETFDFLEQDELNTTTVKGLQDLVKSMFEKRAELEELSKQEKVLNEELEALKSQALKILTAHERTSFDAPGFGSVSIKKRRSVSYPKDPERAAQVRKWLEEQQMQDMLTVNSQSLNSLYNSLADAYEDQGYVPPDLIPGLDAPKTFETISMRKGK